MSPSRNAELPQRPGLQRYQPFTDAGMISIDEQSLAHLSKFVSFWQIYEGRPAGDVMSDIQEILRTSKP
jgi:hypothetical protein